MPSDRAQELELLSDASNNAVVRMPGRRFPGLVIQGDSLNILYRDLRELEETLRTAHGTDSDMTESAKHMADALHERLWWYESALKDAGYQELPYVYSVGKPVESGDG